MENSLYLRALKYIGFRPRSEKEVRDYLQKKIQKRVDGSELIEAIIVKLKSQNFINDLEFAKWLVRSRSEFRPKGKYLVTQELRQKGIPQEIIDSVFTSDIRTLSENDLAISLLFQKKRKYEQMDPQERFNKAGSMLARRGFSLDVIKAAIDQVFGKMV